MALRDVDLIFKSDDLIQLILRQCALTTFLIVTISAIGLSLERQVSSVRHQIHTRGLTGFWINRRQRPRLDVEDVVRRHHVSHVGDRARAPKHRHRRVDAFQPVRVIEVDARRVTRDFDGEFRLDRPVFVVARRPRQAYAKEPAIE